LRVVGGQPLSTIEEVGTGGGGMHGGIGGGQRVGLKGAELESEGRRRKEKEGDGRAGGDGGVEAEPTRGREEDVSSVVQ
jgi:hypothetical protein